MERYDIAVYLGFKSEQWEEKYKTSSIIITHDIECARATADRIIMLKDGEVYDEGKLDHFEKSTDPLIQSFFKSTAIKS